MKFNVHFTNTKLTYDLLDRPIVHAWVEKLQTLTVLDACPINHFISVGNTELISSRIELLEESIRKINARVPGRATLLPLTPETWRHSLNVMHVHFPDLMAQEEYRDLWDVFSTYNDLIHWLESEFDLVWGEQTASRFCINLDFHKNVKVWGDTMMTPLADNDYELFTADLRFGDLVFGYAHVGKHALELLIANDMICPADQFVPQRRVSANFCMRFNDSRYTRDQIDTAWKNFYELRGEDFWGLPFGDPRLAFGYLKFGELVAVDGQSPSTDLETFRSNLGSQKLTHWDFS